jgi:hypothetical protein
MEKPNCYECIYRRDLIGDAHSRCVHPDVKTIVADKGSLIEMLGLLGSVGRGPGLNLKMLGVTGHPHGVKQGWFNWPVNFDPVWLETCDGFIAKVEGGGNSNG